MPTTPDSTGDLALLAKEIADLRDLFHRRLLDDRDRRELYDKLYAELEFARGGVIRDHLAPLARELLLVVDGMDVALCGALADGTAAAAQLAQVRGQVLEILSHHGVRPLSPAEEFDPLQHEAIATVPCEAELDGRITEVRRTGYVIGDRLLRPAQVYIGRHSPPEREPIEDSGIPGDV